MIFLIIVNVLLFSAIEQFNEKQVRMLYVQSDGIMNIILFQCLPAIPIMNNSNGCIFLKSVF